MESPAKAALFMRDFGPWQLAVLQGLQAAPQPPAVAPSAQAF